MLSLIEKVSGNIVRRPGFDVPGSECGGHFLSTPCIQYSLVKILNSNENRPSSFFSASSACAAVLPLAGGVPNFFGGGAEMLVTAGGATGTVCIFFQPTYSWPM